MGCDYHGLDRLSRKSYLQFTSVLKRSPLQMAKSYNYRRNWIENFAKCPLVDAETKTYRHQIAHQLFYGKTTDDYPPEYPSNFKAFHNTIYLLERGDVLDEVLKFLHFIGLKLTRESLDNHLHQFPAQYHQFTKKAYYILRTIAHQQENFN